jgi:hypothetical protein
MKPVTLNEAVSAWHELKELVRVRVETQPPSEHKLQWLASSKLVLSGPWQVEAQFADVRAQFEVRYQRFGAALGQANIEVPIGVRIKGPEVWGLTPVWGDTHIFWRLNDVYDITPDSLVTRVLDRLATYYQEYKLHAIT